MDQNSNRKEAAMDSQGYLGNSRVILNHFDAATQADIQHTALSYESEDEAMGRSRSKRGSTSSGTPLYSKQDIREQYCISERGLGALEAQRGGLFGCLSGQHVESPCGAAARGGSLLTVCVRRRVPSDENLYELCRRQPADYAPMQRYPRYPLGAPPPEVYRYDEDLECSYFRRRPRSLCGGPDPSRYTWLPADEEATRMERPRPIRAEEFDHRHSAEHLVGHVGHGSHHALAAGYPLCPAHPVPPPPLVPALAHDHPVHRPKHVSFARSHTLTSFDDAVVSIGAACTGQPSSRLARSQERLLDGRKTADPPPITRQPEPCEPPLVLMEKLKRAPMKTQATQTEVCLGRKPVVPSAQLTLSPRTIHRVKMVSQGAQTNGVLLVNGRKLMKSLSEAGGRFGVPPEPEDSPVDHEPLQRTQSEEPPRSPFIPKSPSPEPTPQSESPSIDKSEHDSDSESKYQKEIIIDFEPQIPSSPLRKKPLLKTSSDGEMLLDKRRVQRQQQDLDLIPHKVLTSISHDNICIQHDPEPRVFTPYFQNSPIRHEDIFKDLNDHVYSDDNAAGFRAQDSLDEEFHENLIYGQLFRKGSTSTSEADAQEAASKNNSSSPSAEEDGVVPTVHLMPEKKISPFASTDSLANDARDHSDGIWNESQATVLQAPDSGTENGTGLSTSELSTLTALSPGAALLLTPSTKRKHLLLLQHQQRSSMDTDALDEEIQTDQTQQPHYMPSPKVIVDAPTISLAPPEAHPRRPTSPARQRRAPEPPAPESPIGTAVVPDLLLARTDSGKTNTDVSESTTTTDDYITANSGTDSSRRSGSYRGNADHGSKAHHAPQADGSSFESASSMYSVARGDTLAEDMVVPSFSPPPIAEEASETAPTPVPHATSHSSHHHHGHHGSHTRAEGGGRTSPSGSSSSSGSYSLNGSCADLGASQRPPVPSPRHKAPSVSDDERSARYSSSGYYESPLEDESANKTPRMNGDKHEWTDEDKKRKKRAFILEINKNQSSEDQKQSPSEKQRSPHKPETPPAVAPPPTEETRTEKPKRGKSRNRSPMQGGRRNHISKKSPPGLVRSPAMHDGFRPDDWERAGADGGHPAHTPHVPHTAHQGRGSSDESSAAEVQSQGVGQVSPRRVRKVRDPIRRKSTPRSPTSSRSKRRCGSGDDKPSSLPGSLPRRKNKAECEENVTSTPVKSTRISPYRSPSGSPKKRRSSKVASPEHTTRLKALSAESLRSVSPGSDSVFYSDPSSHAQASEHQVHCLHCGKEVDIVTTDEPDKSASSNGQQPDIVQPPEGFADSPRQKHAGGRLYKKLEKRFRSEERGHAERRHHKYRADVRAKSEERGKEECSRVKLRPMARSTDNSLERVRATGSSPSVLSGSPEAEDECGMYSEPYDATAWIYIGDSEHVWHRHDTPPSTGGGDENHSESRRDSTSSTASTESEHEFRKRYQAITHRMVHRKSCLEMYKRQASKSFESDKTIVVRRESGEFGFRIHGSKPVVVSAIEPDTPAESSGLEIGDIVLAVNGVSVLDKSHSEVVKIAHAGSDTLTLEVARTCGVLSPPSTEVHDNSSLYSGYLWKQGGQVSGTPTNKWIRRWFCLKKDNCFYSYKTDADTQPVGAMMLLDYEVLRCDDTEPGASPKPFRFYLKKPGSPALHLAGDCEQAANRWQVVLAHAAEQSLLADTWLEQTKRNLSLSPNALQKPDCFGYLNKLGSKWKTWSRRYCVLKDACLYFYQDANSKNSFGMACLHGYRVQQSTAGGKKHAFEVLPSESTQKNFYFHTESEMDRKRWLAALEYSIDRWLKVG